MDLIKKEPEVDPLGLQHNTYKIEENNTLSKESSSLFLEVTDMKTECGDQNYDIKTEIKVEHTTPVPTSFPMVKSEVDEDLFDVDIVQQEQKVEIPSKEDEVFSESFADTHDSAISSNSEGFGHQDHTTVQQAMEDSVSSANSLRAHVVVMDVIKTEPDINPLAKETSYKIHIEERNSISGEGNIYDLHATEIKSECMDHSYDLKSEVTFEETSVPIDFPIVKSEAEEEALELNKVEEKVKLEVTTEEDEVFTESIEVPDSCNGITENECLQTVEKTFKCDVCGKLYLDFAKLTSHSLLHMRKRPFICKVCGKDCFEFFRLERHVRVHTGEKPFSCNICGKKFSDAGYVMKKHARVHTGEKPFSCDLCKKNFSDLCNLKQHVRVHTGDKPFSCDVCGNKFNQYSHLKKHAYVHTGEKPFRCHICMKTFSVANSLKHHVLLHSGEKPFSCEECGKKFLLFSSFKKHERLHTDEKAFNCVVCGKKFSILGNLKQHALVHTGEKPYCCHICGKKFSQSSHLKKHERVHRGDKT
ncbi:zinc finger protein ZFP2-like [Periplaneta americana]|uniref:zinc finger protein ZFP2-like n=1 Tax=Periplaneta americana TaxID=6978 RepID=UPI0037E86C9B